MGRRQDFTSLARHKFNVLRDHRPDEFARLKGLIREHGFNSGFPITIYQGCILDGWHRYQACLELGVVPVFQDFDGGDVEALAFVKIAMAHRDMSIEERAAVAVALLPFEEEAAKDRRRATQNNDSAPEWESFPTQDGRARDLAGEAVGVSGKTVEKAAKVAQQAPEVFERMRQGQYGSVERASRVARLPSEQREELHELMDSGLPAKEAERDVKKRTRRDERSQKINEIAKSNAPLDLGTRYPVIYADPPWRYEHSRTESREIENQYPTMTLEEICELPVDKVAAPDAVLLMWATSPKLAEALQVVTSWGFTYRTNMVWDKEVIGMGYYARQQHELLLICTRGKLPVPEPASRPRSVFRERRGKHSAKPAAFYTLIEDMYPEFDKIELFCRNPRPGWAVWGNQSEAA